MNNVVGRISSLELDAVLDQVPEYKTMFKNATEYHALMRVVGTPTASSNNKNDCASTRPLRPNPPLQHNSHHQSEEIIPLYDDELFDLDCQAAASVATAHRKNKGLA